MEPTRVLRILREGKLEVRGQFVRGSNYTFLANLALDGESLAAVYKPARGEMPLYDFPQRSLAHREAAAWILSEALSWRIVPPTVYRSRGPLGGGSVQLYIDHDPSQHYFTFSEQVRHTLRPAALFDLIVNNADRKAGHFLLDTQGHVWLIDQGLCFNREDKLRTVLWEFAGEPFPVRLQEDLARVQTELATEGSEVRTQLAGHLRSRELSALSRRMQFWLEAGVYPQPPEDRRYYPWPPV